MRRRMLPWPLETRAPWLDFNPWARELQTPNAYKALTQELRVSNPRCYAPTLGCLATLYAQSRPAMLSRRCITATAGTSLVRDSQTGAFHYTTPRPREC